MSANDRPHNTRFGGIIGSLGDFHARTQAAKLLQSVVAQNLERMTSLMRLCPS